MPDQLRLLIDGLTYSGWEAATLFRTIEAASGSFSVEVAEAPTWTLRPGQELQVLIDDEPFMTGRVDKVRRSFDRGGKKTTIEGRDLAADLVDCSALLDAGELRDIPLEDLAALLAGPLDVEIAIGTDVDPTLTFPLIAITPGESAWECLERAMRMRGLLAFSQPTGELLITRPSTAPATEAVVEGQNMKAGSIDRDDSARYAAYVVTSQRRGSDQEFALVDPFGQAQDAGARAPRTLIVQAEQNADDANCEQRAQWEAAFRAARADPASATCAGWRFQPSGRLWTINRRVRIKSPTLRLDEERLLSATRLQLDRSGGRTTELTLMRPDAFLPQPVVPPTQFGIHGIDDVDGGDESVDTTGE